MAYTIEYGGDDESGLIAYMAFLAEYSGRYSSDRGWVIGLTACIGYTDENVTEDKSDFVLLDVEGSTATLQRYDSDEGEGVGDSFTFDISSIDTVEVY